MGHRMPTTTLTLADMAELLTKFSRMGARRLWREERITEVIPQRERYIS
jgi:hypothetical protein